MSVQWVKHFIMIQREKIFRLPSKHFSAVINHMNDNNKKWKFGRGIITKSASECGNSVLWAHTKEDEQETGCPLKVVIRSTSFEWERQGYRDPDLHIRPGRNHHLNTLWMMLLSFHEIIILQWTRSYSNHAPLYGFYFLYSYNYTLFPFWISLLLFPPTCHTKRAFQYDYSPSVQIWLVVAKRIPCFGNSIHYNTKCCFTAATESFPLDWVSYAKHHQIFF